MRSKPVLTFVALLLVYLVSGSASAQTSRRNFTRAQTYDVQHYVMRVNFDRPAKKVIGETTIRFTPLRNGLRVADFDAVGISFHSVAIQPSGKALKFKTRNGKITVTLDRAYKPGEEVTLHLKHTATPKKGVYFVDKKVDEDGKLIHSSQIWTQGEPDESRHWFPSFDFPSDKATTEQFITANANETVIGNGELADRVTNSDGSVTFHYRMKIPIPTYLISFVIGEYVRLEDKHRDIPLGFVVYPGSEQIARKAFGGTRAMMEVFESVTGVNYPYNKYDQTIVSAFDFGGMENITATTMADIEIFSVMDPLREAGVGDLVSHELAHSWFGNLVTCRNWAELWLNEGFATFMEAVFREKAYGRGSYINKIRRDALEILVDDTINKKRTGLFNIYADELDKLFERPATNYNKGGAVLHTLREEIGDEAFWKAVNIYLTRHRFGNVETSDLKKVMEETSGRDLGWFFDQWVYMAGHPEIDVVHTWDPATSSVRLTVTQTQKADRMTPAAFRIPMEVQFTVGDEKTIEKITIDKRDATFSIKLPAKPEKIEFDPGDKVPIKMVKITP